METPHYRKLDLQSPLDLTYLHNNTVTLSRQKLNLHLPPNTSSSSPDPMRERVREFVDDFITRTFQTASPSLTINGLDAPSFEETLTEASTTTRETVEYEPYDTRLAGRVTALYAQLESLTTAVAKLRRDAPRRAAGAYAEALRGVLEDDEEGDLSDQQGPGSAEEQRADWTLEYPLGNENEASRWREGDMAEVYEDALRTLLRLQGEVVSGEEVEDVDMEDSSALATTVGKAERAGRAVEVVENM